MTKAQVRALLDTPATHEDLRAGRCITFDRGELRDSTVKRCGECEDNPLNAGNERLETEEAK